MSLRELSQVSVPPSLTGPVPGYRHSRARDDAAAVDGLGMREHEWRVYEAALDRPRSTVVELAILAKIADGEAECALRGLEDMGLVSRCDGCPSRFVPAPPDVAVDALVARRQASLERARLEASRLTQRYVTRTADHGDIVEVIHGRRAVMQSFEQLQRATTTEFLAFDKPPYATPNEDQLAVEESVLSHNVVVRAVYERSTLEDPAAMALMEKVVRAGEQARVVDEVPMKLAVADRRQALVPLGLDHLGTDDAVLVRPSGLLRAIVTLFEALWRCGVPLPDPDANGAEIASTGCPDVTPGDRHIIELLLTGLTDQAIARHLGVSSRTVARRVRRLMDFAGVSTRFQLGYRARERGWV